MSATAPSSASLAADFLPFHRALIEAEEIAAVVEVLQSGWLTTGPRVKQFEAAFAQFTGAAHAAAVSSCTAALHLALAAIGLRQGDEVILPTMTFAASGEVVLYFGARPVLIDSAPGSPHIAIDQIESAITPKTKAILPVHFAGSPCDMDPILDIARRHSLHVIEDAAHSFPASYKGKSVGTLGDITCFSFYATKTLTTGEGGMITTQNDDFASRMRILSLHGISRDAWKRYSADGSWRYDIETLGYKYNLTDLQAALGLAQLAKCESMRATRAALAARYTRELSALDAFVTPPAAPLGENSGHAWHLYVLHVNDSALRIDRDRLIQELKLRGIGTSVHFIPLHLHTLYRDLCGYRPGQFPNAEKQFASCLSLPLFPGMTPDEQSRVIQALHDIARIHAQ